MLLQLAQSQRRQGYLKRRKRRSRKHPKQGQLPEQSLKEFLRQMRRKEKQRRMQERQKTRRRLGSRQQASPQRENLQERSKIIFPDFINFSYSSNFFGLFDEFSIKTLKCLYIIYLCNLMTDVYA